MLHFRFVLIAVAGISSGAAQADPTTNTCRFLDVMGSNNVVELADTLAEIAPRFSEDRNEQAAQQLGTVLEASPFIGGSAWRVVKFGEDIEEHLVLIRLKEGEVAGARLRYEWTAQGLSMVNLEVQRKYAEFTALQFTQAPERLDCGE
ncbi:MAG: hypothetical protein AAF678_01460 [Pseudomonadota bacterium]